MRSRLATVLALALLLGSSARAQGWSRPEQELGATSSRAEPATVWGCIVPIWEPLYRVP
jgi:hypothetical protein